VSDSPELLSQMLAKQDQILDELRAFRRSVDALEARGTTLEARFAAFVTTVETRLDVIDTRLDATDRRLSGIEALLTRVAVRIAQEPRTP
jgi:hypothetical protein